MIHSHSHASSTEMLGKKPCFEPETMRIQIQGTLDPTVGELEMQMSNIKQDQKGHLYSRPPLYRQEPVAPLARARPLTTTTWLLSAAERLVVLLQPDVCQSQGLLLQWSGLKAFVLRLHRVSFLAHRQRRVFIQNL